MQYLCLKQFAMPKKVIGIAMGGFSSEKKIILLGGISKDKIKLIKMLDCEGFAGITYFKKKGP